MAAKDINLAPHTAVAGTRLLAVATGVVSLTASLVFTLSVTRRLPTGELAVLALFNSAFAVALAFVGYASTWYPRILAKEPEKFGQLAAVGLIMAFIASVPLAAYLALYGRVDPWLLAIGIALLILNAWPAGAYLTVHRQRLGVYANLAGQAVKIAGAFAVRLNPTAYLALLINVFMSLPTALMKIERPRFSGVLAVAKSLIKGAPYQTLSLIAAALGGLTTYAVYLAGGDRLLSYSYVLFQISKAVYPALAVVPLMYGSLLVESDKLRRALIDGSALLYLYLIAAAVMAKAPQWYIAVLRPSELSSAELAEAVWLNGAALLASGIYLHINTTLAGIEGGVVFRLKDKPSKALIFDIALSPLSIALTYFLSATYGAPGMVVASVISSAVAIGYRARLLGRGYARLFTELYIPAAGTLAVIYLTPLPLFPYSTASLIDAVATFIPNAAVLAAFTAGLLLAFSKPAREATGILFKRIMQIRV